MYTTLRFYDGDMGDDTMLVRCDLCQASSPIEANYDPDYDDWSPTQYQCADARHYASGLAEIGKTLAANAMQVPVEGFDCQYEEIEDAEDDE